MRGSVHAWATFIRNVWHYVILQTRGCRDQSTWHQLDLRRAFKTWKHFSVHLHNPESILTHTHAQAVWNHLFKSVYTISWFLFLFFLIFFLSQFSQLPFCYHLSFHVMLRTKPRGWSHVWFTSHILSAELCNSQEEGLELLRPDHPTLVLPGFSALLSLSLINFGRHDDVIKAGTLQGTNSKILKTRACRGKQQVWVSVNIWLHASFPDASAVL